MTTVDMVNRPPHYNQYSIEVIEVTRYLPFNVGNAVKYLLRHPFKGNSEQDIDKALWYLRDQIENFGPEFSIEDDGLYRRLDTLLDEYWGQDGFDKQVYQALVCISTEDLPRAVMHLESRK